MLYLHHGHSSTGTHNLNQTEIPQVGCQTTNHANESNTSSDLLGVPGAPAMLGNQKNKNSSSFCVSSKNAERDQPSHRQSKGPGSSTVRSNHSQNKRKIEIQSNHSTAQLHTAAELERNTLAGSLSSRAGQVLGKKKHSMKEPVLGTTLHSIKRRASNEQHFPSS